MVHQIIFENENAEVADVEEEDGDDDDQEEEFNEVFDRKISYFQISMT